MEFDGRLVKVVDFSHNKQGRGSRWRQAPRRKHDEHQQLLKAVLARDAARAVDLLQQHIGRTAQLVAAALTQSETAALQ